MTYLFSEFIAGERKFKRHTIQKRKEAEERAEEDGVNNTLPKFSQTFRPDIAKRESNLSLPFITDPPSRSPSTKVDGSSTDRSQTPRSTSKDESALV